MQSTLYVGLSAQMALQRRLDTLAGNMANVSTAGFRGEEISFEELLSTSNSPEPTSFVSKGESHLSLKAGELTQTGNSLDVAVRGSSWLAIQTANGTAYTRDGRMQMTKDGMLTTLTGQPFLDAGGSPLQVDPAGAPPVINKAGTVTQNGRNVGALGLYRIPQQAKLTRAEGASVTSSVTPTPELDFISNGVVQGFVEKSNVNPILEMTHLITIQRSFEAVSNMLHDNESSLQDALKTIAGT